MAEVDPLTPEESEAAAEAFAALVAQGLESVITQVMEEAGIAEEDLATLAPADVDRITVLWEAFVAGSLLPFLVESIGNAHSETVTALTQALNTEVPSLNEPLDTQRYLEQARNRLVGIGNELWFNARAAIADGLAAGESIPTIAARVRDAADVTAPRAQVIARTESHGARNAVNHQTVKRVGAAFQAPGAVRRRWQAANDERTRESHRRADGQEVGLNEPFQVGRASLDFPGDPAGPADEVINCRCTSITVLDTDALDTENLATTVVLNAAADADEEHTGAMIALAPTEADAQRLAIGGYEAAEELHLTLAFLGEAADWTPEQQAALIAGLESTEWDASDGIEGDAFAVNHWNPRGDDPCWVLGVGGETIDETHRMVWDQLDRLQSDLAIPAVTENHRPWVPHVTLAYATDTELVDALIARTGPVTFDRLRVAFGGENTYIPLGGTVTADAYQEDEDMPWSVTQADERCGEGEWAVVKDEDGELEGCHATEDEALAQVAALNAAEDEAEQGATAADMGGRNTVPWSGVLVVEGTPTGDGRQFAPGSLDWPELGSTASLEIPLGWKYERAHGGMDTDKVVTVGRIDSITRQGNELYGTGVMDLDSPWGREAARMMGTRDNPGFLAGVSIDADDPEDPRGLDVEYVFPESCALNEHGQPVAVDDVMQPEQMAPDDLACLMPEMEIYHSGRIRAATLVDIPAYVEARLYLDEPVPEADDATAPSDTPVTAAAYTMTIPDLPPAAWFDEPSDEPDIGAITVTDDGRVYGYLAPKHVAHRGHRDKRVEVPMGNVDYGVWMNRTTIADDGRGGFQRIATGPITMDCGHAPTNPRVRGAARRDHYDNSCSVVATVRAGENSRGVWIAGAVLPDISPDQVRRMMACQLSGDWGPHREKPGKRELAAALLVPVPGFPRRTYSHVGVSGGYLNRVSVPVRFGVRQDAPTTPFGAQAAAERIAASIGRDREGRLRAFASNLQNILKGDD